MYEANKLDRAKLEIDRVKLDKLNRKRRHILSRADDYRLYEYLKAQWPRIMQQRPTYSDLAKQASEELGIEINFTNISGCVTGMGLKWPGGQGRGKSKNPNRGSKDRVRYLAKVLAILMEKMGEPIPEPLNEIISGYASKTQDATKDQDGASEEDQQRIG